MASSDLDTTTTNGAGHAKDFGWTVDSHQYSLSPVDATRIDDRQNSFTIGLESGQIAVKLNAKLDHETQKRITLYVKVTDQNKNGGWSQAIEVEGSLFINVNNINEKPVVDPAGPFYFVKLSTPSTEIGTLTATDPDISESGYASACCSDYRFQKGTVTISGSWGGSTDGDIAVNPTTGVITVAKPNIDSDTIYPTTYVMSITVDDLPTSTSNGYNKATSAAVDVKVEVIDENSKPVVTGKSTGSTLSINENSIGGTKVSGGFVTCTDYEVEEYCSNAKNIACNQFTTQSACDDVNTCEWITSPRAANNQADALSANRCACRRQKLEFFAVLDNPQQKTPEGDNLGIIFTFKSGVDSDTPILYDNGLASSVGGSLTGVKVKAEVFVLGSSASTLDYESFKSLDITYGCRDTGFRDGDAPNDPHVGWMQSDPSPACSSPPCIYRVKININDVNEAPIFQIVVGPSGKFEMEVDENKDYTAITENYEPYILCRDLDKIAPSSTDTTDAVTLVLQNLDGTDSSQFELVKEKSAFCKGSIVKPTGTASSGWLPNFEQQQYYDLKIIASDQGNPNLPGTTGDPKSSTLLLRIRVRDNNDQPEITRHSNHTNTAWSVQEDAPAAFVVGKFQLVDADIDFVDVTWREPNSAVDVLTATIQSGNTGTAFELVVASGKGTVKDPTIVEVQYRGEMPTFPGATEFGLDYERQKQYILVVRVTDAGGPNKMPGSTAKPDAANPLRPAWTKTALWSEITQTIDVVDVNDVTIEKVVVQTDSLKLSTGGGDKVKITGTNFGAVWSGSSEPILEVTYTNPSAPADASMNDPTNSSGTGSIGVNTVFSAQNCMRNNSVASFVANTEIICDAGPGFGDNQIWTVKITGSSVGQMTGAPHTSTSYNYPVITSVAISSGATTMSTLGGESVLLIGTNMGPVGTQYWGDYGPTRLGGYGYCAGRTTGTGTWCTTTVANTQVTCTTSAGLGTLTSWRLQERKHSTWKTQDHSLTTATNGNGTISYSPPTITDIQLPPQAVIGGGLRTQGGEDVIITGTGFGSPNTNLHPCREEALPPIGNAYAPGGPTAPVARYGFETGLEFPRREGGCSETTTVGCGANCVVVSDTQMICTTEAAVGANHSWTVLVATQRSAPSAVLTSHRIPVLSRVSGAGLKGGSTVGGAVVTINGDQFGPLPPRNDMGNYLYKIEANYGRWSGDNINGGWNTDIVPIFISEPCVMVTAHTQLQCVTKPGIGRNLSWTITVHAQTAQTSLPNHAEGSYAPPNLFTLTSSKALPIDALVTEGNNKIVIRGNNFGPDRKSWNVPIITYGKIVGVGETEQLFIGRNCSVTKAHVTIVCDTDQGAGFSHMWSILIGGQLNTPASSGYAAPILYNITGSGSVAGDTSGNQWVTIHGNNFGPPASAKRGSFLERVTYGKTGTEYTAKDCFVANHRTIKCKTVPGVGTYNIWLVRVAGQVNNLLSSPVTSYAVPKCWAMYDKVGPENEESDIDSKWTTDPTIATDRIELHCEHTGLGDSLASTRYIRYSVAGYERHIDLDVANTKRIGTPGTPESYEQIQFVTPPLEWSSQPAASVPVTLVLTTASGEIMETTPLRHSYSAPEIISNPTGK